LECFHGMRTTLESGEIPGGESLVNCGTEPEWIRSPVGLQTLDVTPRPLLGTAAERAALAGAHFQHDASLAGEGWPVTELDQSPAIMSEIGVGVLGGRLGRTTTGRSGGLGGSLLAGSGLGGGLLRGSGLLLSSLGRLRRLALLGLASALSLALLLGGGAIELALLLGSGLLLD